MSSPGRSSRNSAMVTSDMSELAAHLPSSPANMNPPSVGGMDDQPRGGPGSVYGTPSAWVTSPGPGSVYGTPSSVGSSLRTPRTGSRGTPIRVRSDIQSDRRIRQVPVEGSQSDAMAALPPSSDIVPPSENSESVPTMVIWGTDVSVNQCKCKTVQAIFTSTVSSAPSSSTTDKKVSNSPPSKSRSLPPSSVLSRSCSVVTRSMTDKVGRDREKEFNQLELEFMGDEVEKIVDMKKLYRKKK
eukprot:GFUD01002325.1.p1 GENE.GFUD01002325.1~~GFUD01002325.1.p1  ORF type:complete len:257 (+),score=76.30 GFUD01002325.1:46-771(+)